MNTITIPRMKTFTSLREAESYLSNKRSIPTLNIYYGIDVSQEVINHHDSPVSVSPNYFKAGCIPNNQGFTILIVVQYDSISMRVTTPRMCNSLMSTFEELSGILHGFEVEEMFLKYATLELTAKVDADLATLRRISACSTQKA